MVSLDITSRLRPRLPSRTTVMLSLLAGGAGLGGSYAVGGSTDAFVGAPVSAFVFTSMPAPVVTFSIVTLGKLGTQIGYALALGVAVGLLAGTALAGIVIGRRTGVAFGAAGTAGGLGWSVSAALTGEPFGALGAAVPMTAFLAILEYRAGGTAGGERRPLPRRDLLASVGGVAGFGGIAYAFGSQRRRSLGDGTSSTNSQQLLVDALIEEAEGESLDIEGMTGLVSRPDEFYEVDINLVNPTVSADEWTLEFTGDVGTERTITYDELTAVDPEHRFLTLRCVGDRINGDLMDNALWTGVPMVEYLDSVQPQGEYVVLHADDGYFEEFPLSALERGFLAYGMNGEVLPEKHGYPVRALIPGHWGEINVKWITEIEVVDEPIDGYWEKRGWHGTGPVNTVAKLRAVNHLDDGRIQVGGHAYAGVRGVREVEVSVDGGDSWEPATLSEPLKDADVWRQWRYEWQPTADAHDVVVRAVDGTGTLQRDGTTEDERPFPDGAVGWVSETVEADPE